MTAVQLHVHRKLKILVLKWVCLFQIQDIVEKHNVEVLSSNYKVYAEMSKRFHSILAEYVAPGEHEIYSIDECFLDLTAYEHKFDLTEYAQDMRERIANGSAYLYQLALVAVRPKPRLPTIWPRKPNAFQVSAIWYQWTQNIRITF
jgi:nucleotidyltransferase/DNA polymerase involved in DNA repair